MFKWTYTYKLQSLELWKSKRNRWILSEYPDCLFCFQYGHEVRDRRRGDASESVGRGQAVSSISIAACQRGRAVLGGRYGLWQLQPGVELLWLRHLSYKLVLLPYPQAPTISEALLYRKARLEMPVLLPESQWVRIFRISSGLIWWKASVQLV